MLTGQNGILNRASEAKEKTDIANKDEQRKLAQAEALMNTEKTTYKGVTLPEGFAPTKIDGEDSIDDGLVITDGYGNEYVWVEVPKTIEVYSTVGLGVTNFTDDEYEKIENDLHTYTSDYRNEINYSDIYAPDGTTGWFKDEKEYNNAKRKMLKSIYQNGGFWVGRYEAGIEENRTDSGTATIIPLSKENLYPYTYVTRTQAKVLAEQVKSGSYVSSLMFGVQWDLILKYIEEKTVALTNEANKDIVRGKILNNLKKDSTNIGNYYNSKLKLTRGKFTQYNTLLNWHNFDSEDKKNLVIGSEKLAQDTSENGIVLTTGATDDTKLKNIYDISGNIWEWTLERDPNNEYPCTSRGGCFNNIGSACPANYRLGGNISYSNDIGFRFTIY